jgi:pimeloyl-ACP methyl ester carboxylesterase
MLGWPDEFCARLAAGQRFVIRYDQRDTGRSVSFPPGQPGYRFSELVADTIGILDALGVARAGLVGLSMGGGIVMAAALAHPARVTSLILIATTPGGPDLPPGSDEFSALVGGPQPDWADRTATSDHIIAMLRFFSGGSGHFDEAAMRAEIGRDLDRTTNVASAQSNHFAMAIDGDGDDIGAIAVPTLVIHGDNDPIFPLGHAEAAVRMIPGAKLLVLEGTGHELPRASWDRVVPAIVALTAG